MIGRLLERSPGARIAFAVAYFSVQIALIATASARPDGAFGFRMFPESSTVSIHLSRAVDSISGNGTTLVDVANGTWSSRTPRGDLRMFAWRDRVREPELSMFDMTFQAPYGADAELSRLRDAIEDVAAHISDDVETRALALDVTVRKNGRDPYVVHIASREREPR